MPKQVKELQPKLQLFYLFYLENQGSNIEMYCLQIIA
jgi:hypothetical protein